MKKKCQGSAGVPCPECSYTLSWCVDSRARRKGDVRRRRECLSCGARYTTVEVIQSAITFVGKAAFRLIQE